MAVTATFLADFTKFSTAVDKAVLQLKDIESGAGRVEKSLSKMADSFSGKRVIQEAQLATKAIGDIQNISKLTASEQGRLNNILSEGLAKYKALGQEAPKAMQDLHKALQTTKEPADALTAKAVAIGSAFGSIIGGVALRALSALGQGMADAAKNGVQLTSLVTSFDRLSASIGESGDAMLTVTRSATKGLVSDLNIMQSANKAMLLGLPVTSQEMGVLAKAAVTLGRAMGQDAGKSLDDLITALGRSSPMILDNLGLTVKVGDANEAYAAKVGKSAAALTQQEQKLAFYQAAMEAARKKTDDLGGIQLTLSDKVDRAKTSVGNLIATFARGVAESPAFETALDKVATAAQRLQQRIDDVKEARERLGTKAQINVADELATAVDNAKLLEDEIEKIERHRMFQAAETGAPSIATSISRFNVPEQPFRGATDADIDILENRTKKLQEQLDKRVKAETDAAQALAREYKRQMDVATATFESVDKIEADMLASRRALEASSYAEQERLAFGFGTRILQHALDLNQSLISLDAQRLRKVLAFNVPQATAGANEAGKLGSQAAIEWLDGFRSGLSGIGDSIIRALEGGGNVVGSIAAGFGNSFTQKTFGSEQFKSLMNNSFGSALGGMFNSVLPGIGALAGPLFSKIASVLKRAFGGPSEQELAGRASTDEFTRSLESMLDWTEKIEVHQLIAAGNSEKWATQVVAIRDAYVNAGLSVDEALNAVNRLWEAERQGGGATQAIIDEITQKTGNFGDAAKKAADEAAAAAQAAAKEFDGVVASFDGSKIFHEAELAAKAVEKIGGVSHLTTEEARRLHDQVQAAIEKYEAMGLEVPQYLMNIVDATEHIIGATERATEAQAKYRSEIEKTARRTGFSGSLDDMTEGEIADMLVGQITDQWGNPVSKQWIEDWIKGNGRQDIGRLQSAASNYTGAWTGGRVTTNGIQRFAYGGYARGTDTVPAMLTPGEIVLNKAQQQNVAGALSGGDVGPRLEAIYACIEALRRDINTKLPRSIRDAVDRAA